MYVGQQQNYIRFDSSFLGDLDNLLNEFGLAPSVAGVNGYGTVPLQFENFVIGDGSSRGPSISKSVLSSSLHSFSAALLDNATMQQGMKIYSESGTPTEVFFVGGAFNDVSLGSVTVTVGASGTATFTAADASILQTGDMIWSATATNYENYDGTVSLSSGWECLGLISNINVSTITIKGIPQNLATGTMALHLGWWSKFHQPSTCTTNTSTSLTSCSPANATTWRVGNRIKGTGIPAGAYVTANDGAGNITISKAATASASGIRIYDADVYSLTGTAV